MRNAQNKLFDSFGLLPDDFGSEISDRLNERLEKNEEYSREEIQRVSQASHRICSPNFQPELQDYERIRVLCILSQCALNSVNSISSHRKYIGPIIVKCKQLLWKIISPQLEKTFSGLEEFNSWMLVSHLHNLEKLQEVSNTTVKGTQQ